MVYRRAAAAGVCVCVSVSFTLVCVSVHRQCSLRRNKIAFEWIQSVSQRVWSFVQAETGTQKLTPIVEQKWMKLLKLILFGNEIHIDTETKGFKFESSHSYSITFLLFNRFTHVIDFIFFFLMTNVLFITILWSKSPFFIV